MPRLVLRIASGARAGEIERFDTTSVTFGRHPESDLRFDAERDRDVSARHAELRWSGSGWLLVDRGSTNGTLIDGRRITGAVGVAAGDRIGLGPHGPVVEVVEAEGTRRRDTTERVALAVEERTSATRRLVVTAVVAVAVIAAAAVWLVDQRAQGEVAAIRAAFDSAQHDLGAELARLGDTAARTALARRSDSVREQASGSPDAAASMALQAEIARSARARQRLATMTRSEIATRNGAAVAFLMVYYGDDRYGATAFGLTASGLLATNRHNIAARDGRMPTRLLVKFADTEEYRPARVVRTSASDEVDLALLQVEVPGSYPSVLGVSESAVLAQGDPVVILGFPGSLDLPMDGLMARSTLNAGLVSKRAPGILQIDAYAAHGSSGSPVFDSTGVVVGVVYGGDPASEGRVVYAVPADRLAELLPSDARRILRP